MTNNILASYIAAYDEANEITAPADRILEVLVISGVATLRFLPGDIGLPPAYDNDVPLPTIDVPAKALYLALKAQIEEDGVDDPVR